MNTQFADEVRRLHYPYLKAGFIILFCLLLGTLAILVARALDQSWWSSICAGATVTGGAGALAFAAATYIQSARTL
ncbi:hypothetical protein EASAB2608_03501 [Streptomyces sp. EAS-AB2608]|nr:hypothetical protein EASAB2608_03501 [Streptomyces sp. EAS-AB2608]